MKTVHWYALAVIGGLLAGAWFDASHNTWLAGICAGVCLFAAAGVGVEIKHGRD